MASSRWRWGTIRSAKAPKGIDTERVVTEKMEENRAKYPADKVKGSAAKYTEYE